jgi:hypothetical protein
MEAPKFNALASKTSVELSVKSARKGITTSRSVPVSFVFFTFLQMTNDYFYPTQGILKREVSLYR